MYIYLLNIFILVIVGIIDFPSDNLSESIDKKRKRICVVGAINWILISGLRHVSIGADTIAYQKSFNGIAKVSWSYVWNQLILKYSLINTTDAVKDPGYLFLQKMFQIFSTNYQLWLLFIACIFIIPMAIWIYKYSTNPVISFIVFSTLFYSFFAITGHRQTIATAIAFFGGLLCIEKKKPILFVIVILTSSFIHASSIGLLPLYLLSKVKINKVTLIVSWIIIGMSFIFRRLFLRILQILVIGYSAYKQTDSATMGMFSFLLLTMAVLFTIFNENILETRNDQVVLAANSLFVACILSSLLLISENAMRAVQYYSLFIIILLPDYRYIFDERSWQIFDIMVCLIMIVLLIGNNPVYHFFWESV